MQYLAILRKQQRGQEEQYQDAEVIKTGRTYACVTTIIPPRPDITRSRTSRRPAFHPSLRSALAPVVRTSIFPSIVTTRCGCAELESQTYRQARAGHCFGLGKWRRALGCICRLYTKTNAGVLLEGVLEFQATEAVFSCGITSRRLIQGFSAKPVIDGHSPRAHYSFSLLIDW